MTSTPKWVQCAESLAKQKKKSMGAFANKWEWFVSGAEKEIKLIKALVEEKV